MKKTIPVLILILVFANFANAQRKTQTAKLGIEPKQGTGFYGTMDFIHAFSDCFGDAQMLFTYKNVNITQFRYNGKSYTPQDLDLVNFDKYLLSPSFKVEVRDAENEFWFKKKVTGKTVKICELDYVLDNQLAGCYGQTSKIGKTESLNINYLFIWPPYSKVHFKFNSLLIDLIKCKEDPNACDRVNVQINQPFSNQSFDKNVIDFSASFQPLMNDFNGNRNYIGYLRYNNVNQILNPSNGNFTGKIVLKSGINKITFLIKNGEKKVHTSTFNINYTGKPVKLRATLTWDGQADIDLYLKDANNSTCSYNNKNTGMAKLDVDNTTAYGPENISVESIIQGSYVISIKNYSNTNGITATVYIYVNEQLESVTKHRFSGGKNLVNIKTLSYNDIQNMQFRSIQNTYEETESKIIKKKNIIKNKPKPKKPDYWNTPKKKTKNTKTQKKSYWDN